MVYLAITAQGLQGALETAAKTGAVVWCGADTMTEQDFDRHIGSAVSRFNYTLGDATEDDLAGAVETIRLHHPEASIWVESKACNEIFG